MRVLIVAALDTSALCRLPRLFHDAGYEVYLMGPPGLTAMRSRFIDLRISSTTIGGKADLIVAADEFTARGITKPAVQFVLDALEAGIRLPACEICDSPEAALDAARVMGFPVFVKPGGYAASAKEVSALNLRPPLVVMRHPGERGSIAILYNKGVARCWFAYLDRGATIEIFRHDDLAGIVARTGKLVAFTGLCSIKFSFDRERDEVLLTAFNPWPDRCCHLGRVAGVDFAAALRSWNSSFTEAQTPIGPVGQTIALFPEALRDPRHSAACLKDAPWTDPRLLVAELLHHRRLSASSSSSVRGQSDPSNRDNPRSASTFPPV